MKILQTTYLLAFVLLCQSCDPLELDTVDDEPEFSIDMSINNQDYVFEAGNEDYFMQTEVVNGAPTIYSGSLLRRIDNQLIDNQLALTISFQIGEEVFNDPSIDDINSFEVGLIPFNTLDDAALPSKEVTFSADYEGTGSDATYSWDYGDNSMSTARNPIHAYANLQLYTAILKVSDDNQCGASAINTVSFDNRPDCVANIAVTNFSSSNAILEASSNGVSPYQYMWSDGSSENDATIVVTDAVGVQEHCVTITDAEGCQSINCIGIVKDASGVNHCAVSVQESNYTRAIRAKQFNSVEISWRDDMGEEYSSRDVLQGNNSFFEIISFEEYDLNAQGERTVKIDFDFSCTLYLTGGTDPIQVENARGTIAVAIR